jgi:hypothetical protein
MRPLRSLWLKVISRPLKWVESEVGGFIDLRGCGESRKQKAESRN